MLTQATYESLAAIQAMLRDPEHEGRVKEWDRAMNDVAPYRQSIGKASRCLPTLPNEAIGSAKHAAAERATA